MKSLRDDQRGVVSIVITVVFILLMSMIVLAMAQNSNREQRQALDRQLSDQAFYNAESGISDWADWLYKNPNAPATKTDCATSATTYPGAPSSGDVDGDVNSYSCVTYDRAPTSIEINPLQADKSKVFKIKPGSAGDTITRLNFTWKSKSGTTAISGCPATPTDRLPASISSGTCNLTGLRIELFKMGADRDELINTNYVAFLMPTATAGSPDITYAPGDVGVVKGASCTAGASGGCTVRLNIPPAYAISDTSQHYLVIKSVYEGNAVSISADGPGGQKKLVDAQVMIDSTGKANDVLRRVQVRLPAQRVDYQPGTGGSDVLSTKESICKLLDVSDVDRTATFTGC